MLHICRVAWHNFEPVGFFEQESKRVYSFKTEILKPENKEGSVKNQNTRQKWGGLFLHTRISTSPKIIKRGRYKGSYKSRIVSNFSSKSQQIQTKSYSFLTPTLNFGYWEGEFNIVSNGFFERASKGRTLWGKLSGDHSSRICRFIAFLNIAQYCFT